MGPTVVPVLNDSSGKRKIRLAFSIGPDFAQDDVTVKLDGERCLIVEASYEAEIGLYGSQVTDTLGGFLILLRDSFCSRQVSGA